MRSFLNDAFADNAQIEILEAADGVALCRMPILPMHLNAHGTVMGGAIFTLADFAFATLTNDRERITVAQQVSVNYLAAPKGERLVAKSRWRKDGRTSCVVVVDVSDDAGRDVAQFVGTGFKLKG